MGGLFKAPKPVVVAPAAPAPGAPPPVVPVAVGPTAAQAASVARVEAMDRARRGLAATVATSDRGALAALPTARKSLLGE